MALVLKKKQAARASFKAPPGGDLHNYFKASQSLRPLPNVGCLFDCFTGSYHWGKDGETILNGGFGHTVGIAGKGNTFKSVLAHFFILRTLDRYLRALASFYDTEGSVSQTRIHQLSRRMLNLLESDIFDEGRAMLTDGPTMKADEWYRAWRDYGENKISKENAKAWLAESPFWDDKASAYISTPIPTLGEIDSLSMARTTGIQGIFDEQDIGDSNMNTVSLRASRDKSQMLLDMADSTIATNSFIVMTAHVGDKHQLDPRSPPEKQMLFLKQKLSLKDVPQKFTFTPSVVWYVSSAEVMRNDSTKSVEFPRDKNDDLKGDTDLQKLTLLAIRNKYGPSGIPFEIILSQDEGVMVGLTEFNYIRSFNRYGLGGNVQNYHLDLYPEVTLSRTTIRGKIDNDVKLQRALQIVSEMCQMQNHWDDPDGLFCTPKELYEDLKTAGYSWDAILSSRGYWVYKEDEEGLPPYLSTLDLLRARKGLLPESVGAKFQKA